MNRDGHVTVWRVRLGAALILLAALAFHQSPGLVVPDTKLDLTANPAGFLNRALQMWDPQGAFGQLQNQAYGYLFPVGPFHMVLDGLGVPDWIVQRLWWATVLGVAFLGFWRLSGALGVGAPWARYLGALLFALSPRVLSEVAVTSVEVWPLAMAPWVLLPLVDPRPRSWGWRISRSALAFALVGGVNAVASGAALVLPALWLVTRRGAAARKALGLWLVAVTAVSLWWLGPLVLLGRHSPPFLDWIENADVTTAFASPLHALSGTTTWLSFLAGPAGASWPAGWEYVTTPVLVVLVLVPPALGLAGLASRSLPERTFLALATLLGLVLVTLGHTAGWTSPVSDHLNAALDGPLAPLRNTHKFELVVRIPLLLAATHALGLVARLASRLSLARWLVPVLVASLLAALAAPGIVGRMARPEGYAALPEHWRQTASWLDEQRGPGTVLVLPAAGFADFTWGSTKDEPLQALMKRPFAVRDAVPLGSAGATRYLDGLERQLSSGHGGAEVRAALRVAGVRYVVMRNDLRADAARNVGLLVHEALAESGMAEPVVSFGPRVGSPLESPDRTVDSRTRLPYASVEVFDAGPVDDVRLVSESAVVRAAGGPEDVARVLTAVPGAGAVLTGSDGAAALWADTALVLTDGNQRREVFFGRAADNRSEVLTADDDGRTGRTVNDYVSDPAASQTTRAWKGNLREVVASSSASDANATLRLGPAHNPAAAVDGRPETAWVSGRYGRAEGEWLELRFDQPQEVGGTIIRLPQRSPVQARATVLQVETDNGRRTSTVSARGGTQHVLEVPDGPTTRLRLTVTGIAGPPGASGVSIADVEVPEAAPGSALRIPAQPELPDVVLLRRASPSTPECAQVGTRPLCVPELGRQGEEAFGLTRQLDLPAAARFTFTGDVTPVPVVAERLLEGATPTIVTASSRASQGAEARPSSVVDGDLGTGWVAAADDVRPLLRLSLPKKVTTSSLQFLTDQYLAGSRPRSVSLSFNGGREITRAVDDEGTVRWPKRSFKTLTIRFLEWSETTSLDATTRLPTKLPVGVSEVVLPGVSNRLQGADLATGAPCGYGPEIRVGRTRVATSVQGTVEDVLKGRPLSWRVCGRPGGSVDVPAGKVTVAAEMSSEFSPLSMTLTRAGAADVGRPSDGTPNASVAERSATSVTMNLSARSTSGLLVLPQNFNSGWTASDDRGRELVGVRVNGWQQGWLVPAGDGGTVTATFGPGTGYRLFLLLGALLGLACVGWVGLTRRAGAVVVPEPGALAARTPAAVAGFAGLGVLGGPAGIGAAVLAGVAALAARRRRWLLMVLPPAVVVGAGLWVAAAPWPSGNRGTSPAIQALVLVAISVACISPLVPPLSRRSARRPRRMSGRSRP